MWKTLNYIFLMLEITASFGLIMELGGGLQSQRYLLFACSKLWIKLELAKYYKDSEMTAFISERSRNSK